MALCGLKHAVSIQIAAWHIKDPAGRELRFGGVRASELQNGSIDRIALRRFAALALDSLGRIILKASISRHWQQAVCSCLHIPSCRMFQKDMLLLQDAQPTSVLSLPESR